MALLVVAIGTASCATSEPIDLTGRGGGGMSGDAGGGGATGEGGAIGVGAASGAGGQAGGATGSGAAGGGSGGSCGNGVLEAGEECDDANTIAGDGCDGCAIECSSNGLQDPATGHCYRLFGAPGNQPTAEANCAAWGGAPGLGHLASMGSQAENDFVAALIAADTWIGADDFGGSFEWIDGTPFVFENWQSGEPNHPGIEHCMFMDAQAKWHDHNCGDTRSAYLCERGSGPPP